MELEFKVEGANIIFHGLIFFFFFEKLMDLFSKISNIYLLFNIFKNWRGGHNPPLSERGSVPDLLRKIVVTFYMILKLKLMIIC